MTEDATRWGDEVRIANVGSRAKLLVAGGSVDVARAGRGRFGADPQAVFERMAELSAWAETIRQADEDWDPSLAGSPVPAPRQVFAIGLNYSAHASESGFEPPPAPVVFTKWPSSLTGPVTDGVLPGGSVDWEVEVVAVIGAEARGVAADRGWDFVAGLSGGQDLSERGLQRSGPAAQFGLAKSYPGFSPVGPLVVTPDELDHPDDLTVGCEVNGEKMLAEHPERHVWGLGRHHAGANYFWYLRDPAGNYSEYHADLDVIADDAAWTPESHDGHLGLYSWGPPPPASFLQPDDQAALGEAPTRGPRA